MKTFTGTSMSHAQRTRQRRHLLFSPITSLIICTCAMMCAACQGESAMNTTMKIRRSVIAGSWYPGTKAALTREIQGYLAGVDLVLTGKTITALVVPHAGYAYSGRCAAYSYKQLEGRKIERVFLLGPSHHLAFKGASIPDVDAYETPLGLVRLDRDVIAKMRGNPLVANVPQAHSREHSLEIQLPFLQIVLGDFKLIPMVIGDVTCSDAESLGKLVASHLGPRDIIVASGDFTHYGAAFAYAPFRKDVPENITKLDMGLVDLILDKNVPGIFKYVARTGITCCGRWAFAIMVAALPANAKGEKLCYYKSGDMEHDYRHSVSYVSLAFYETGGEAQSIRKTESEPKKETAVKKEADNAEVVLADNEKKTLLKLARDTLTMHVNGKGKPDLDEYELTPRLREKAGAFVTLHKQGQLRGCIGYIQGIAPLAETVRENACNAATEDPRFPRVQPEELNDIDIEISVMSPLRKIDSPDEVVAGKHGVVLKSGWNQGVFLPQVATEQGWDRKTFLSHLGLKARLDTDAYKTAELRVFTAEVFGEKAH